MSLHPQLDEILDAMVPVIRQFQQQSMYAPHAATIDNEGNLSGQALTSDGSNQMTVKEVLEYFENCFRESAQAGKIVASAIFYHSVGINPSSAKLELPPANSIDECNILVGRLEHVSGDSIYIVIPYTGHAESLAYGTGRLIKKPPAVFELHKP